MVACDPVKQDWIYGASNLVLSPSTVKPKKDIYESCGARK